MNYILCHQRNYILCHVRKSHVPLPTCFSRTPSIQGTTYCWYRELKVSLKIESDLMLVSDQAVFSSSCLENLENHKVFEIPWERFISCLRWYDTLWFAHRPVTIERNTCGPEKCIIYNILYCRSVTMDRTTCGSKISVISIDLESGFLCGFDNFHQTVPCERKKNQVLSRSKANS